MNIMVLDRPKGPKILFSGSQWQDFVKALKEDRCRGWVGQFPDGDKRQNIQMQLYHWADFCAERNFQERDFLKRYLLSMVVFLLIFFFLSYVVRDPIPLADELLLALGGAILFQLWWRKRRAASLSCQRDKEELRSLVDRVPFEESPNLKALELYLQSLDTLNSSNKESLFSLRNPNFVAESFLGEREIVLAFEQQWQRTDLRKERRLLKKNDSLRRDDFQDLSALICLEKGVFSK